MPWKEAIATFGTVAEMVPHFLSKADAISWASRLGPAARAMVDLNNPRACAESFGEGPLSAPPEVYTAREIVRAHVRYLHAVDSREADANGEAHPALVTDGSTTITTTRSLRLRPDGRGGMEMYHDGRPTRVTVRCGGSGLIYGQGDPHPCTGCPECPAK